MGALEVQLSECRHRLDTLEARAKEEDPDTANRAQDAIERLRRRCDMLREEFGKLVIWHGDARRGIERRYERALERLNADLEREVAPLLHR